MLRARGIIRPADTAIDCRQLGIATIGISPLALRIVPRESVSTETGFILKIDLRTLLFRPFCNAWVGVKLPRFYCGRFSFISSLERLFRFHRRFRQRFSDSRDAQIEN